MINISDILIKPIISEKSSLNAGKNLYTFQVGLKANKYEIKHAIEKTFSVKVLDVTTVIVKGKVKRAGKKRLAVKKSSWKKAVVMLSPEQKIDLFEVQQ